MNEILNDILTIIGGAGVVLGALFIYFGKLQLEKYKDELDKTKIKISSLFERATHVTKARFDKEFEIYQILWGVLVDLNHATLSLRPVFGYSEKDKTEEQIRQERLNRFYEVNNNFVILMHKYRPFYSSEVNESLLRLNKLTRTEAIEYRHKEPHADGYWESQEMNEKNILDEIDVCCELIKKRIDSLSVVHE